MLNATTLICPQVTIQYKTEEKAKLVDMDTGYCLQDILEGNVRAVRILFKIEAYRNEMMKLMNNEIDKECTNVIETDTILGAKKPEDIADITSQKVVKAITKGAPILSDFITTATMAINDKSTNMIKANILATIFKLRNSRMSAWHHRNTIMLKHEGVSDKALAILSKAGMSMTPNTARDKSNSFGDNFNKDIL